MLIGILHIYDFVMLCQSWTLGGGGGGAFARLCSPGYAYGVSEQTLVSLR